MIAGTTRHSREQPMSTQDQQDSTERPAQLATLSTTQLDELERQFAEDDRNGWDRLCEEYGWSPEDGSAVWTWFGQRVRPAGA
jgi:hypothetical protein